MLVPWLLAAYTSWSIVGVGYSFSGHPYQRANLAPLPLPCPWPCKVLVGL